MKKEIFTIQYIKSIYQTQNTAVFNRLSKIISQLLWFCIATLCDWLENLAPLYQPIISKTKTNRDLLAFSRP